MSERSHHIQRQTLEVKLADAALRTQILSHIRDAEDGMRRGLAQVLQRLDRPGQVVRVSHLELDLGELRPDQLVTGLEEVLPGLLHAALSERIEALESSDRVADKLAGANPLEEAVVSTSAAGLATADTNSDTKLSDAEAALQALLHYLQTGQRAWWVDARGWRQLLTDCARQLEHAVALRQLWHQLRGERGLSLRRLAGPGAWAAVQPAVLAGLGTESVEALQRAGNDLADGPWQGQMVALYLLLSMHETDSTVDSLARSVAQAIATERRGAWLARLGDSDGALAAGHRQGLDCLRAALSAVAAATGGAQADAVVHPGDDGIAPEGIGAGAGERRRVDELSGLAAVARADADHQHAIADGDTIATPSAGLVILQPFIEMLFRTRGLVDEGGRFLPAGQRRGVALLAFLAWRDAPPEEPDLGLEKLLCGLAPTSPWWPLELGDGDRREAEKLLDAVIRHWDALKSTRADGLRQGFLQRSGRLRAESGGFRLRVERSSLDSLLQRLPWTINVLRLPWMSRPLMVEWL